MNAKNKKITFTAGVICFASATAFAVADAFFHNGLQGSAALKVGLAVRACECLFLTVAVVCAIRLLDYILGVKPRGGVAPFLLGLAIAAANFPLIPLINGGLTLVGDSLDIALFALSCAATGALEETLFRGLVFPVTGHFFRKVKFGETYALIIASAIFALSHLLNLFVGAGVGATLMQVGYSFLIGCVCSVVLIASRSIILPVIVHALFNFGGALSSAGVATGNHWDLPSIIIMACVAVFAGVFLALYYFKNLKKAREYLGLES